ncbi:MAG: error-prone polymerase [Cryptosporangiaceae bacterium]|nr:error-prone polymerase [Cryptosporangiaceae bacterium]
MSFNNPSVSWPQLERALSGVPAGADGGDSPAWSRKREPFVPPPMGPRPPPAVPYAELHCHTNFSFLDGASHPEDLASEAVNLGLTALAVTDHDGMYGVARFAEAASAVGLSTVFGAELSLGLAGPQNGVADPEGAHLLVLARDPEGYHRLCREISLAQRAGNEKGRPVYDLESLGAAHGGRWQILTGCRKGTVRQALAAGGTEAAARELDALTALFGAENVAVELIDHRDPLDSGRNDALAALARDAGLRVLASNNVHYATPRRRRLATALAAVRARRSLDEIDGWLPAAATAHLRSGEEMARLFQRYPGAVATAAEIGAECAFSLRLVAPNLPGYPVPSGHTEMSFLRELTMAGARRRYGPPGQENVPGAYAQIEHELAVISQLGFPGYFLIVHHIVDFCRQNRILCQGRGSAANSAVCYALGITNVDAVYYGLLFERFLAPERDGYPDIDLDIESGRREEVIQYVYGYYGRDRAAQVANVISYRPRSAVRDMAKALGYSTGQQDAWSKQLEFWGSIGGTPDHDIPGPVAELAEHLVGFPRHLGIHSGGMVLCDRPVIEVCPVEWGRMPNRTVLQWDKDDCASAGLVKFDLLGLGMLSALHDAFDLIAGHHGWELELATIPREDPKVYDMLCDADSVGVFQVESRAQMATLPRLRPRQFYDLVVEVALIRPGPIQGGSVHPYIRRRNGLEEPSYPHPLLENSLRKTYGVPLFQEQLMQMAIDIAGFSPAEADLLRRAIGSKRSAEKMEQLRGRLFDGMAARGITGELAEDLFAKLAAFANFGFPESHAMSFASLVYASAWIKRYYPAAFCAALLNAQPMGFYSPQSLIADARRHGVTIRSPDINASLATANLEPADPVAGFSHPHAPPDGGKAIRLGLSSVRAIGDDLAERVVTERTEAGPYTGMTDLAQRIGLTSAQVEALATAGAFECFGGSRREALWAAGAVAQARPGRLEGTVSGVSAPGLPELTGIEEAMADVWSTGMSPGTYPTEFARARLDEAGVLPIAELARTEPRTRIAAAGVVTHRQRPATAGGVTFLNLEDETGMLNVVCSPGFWSRYRRVLRSSAALIIRGRLERAEGVVNVVAEQAEQLTLHVTSTSRNFR